MTSTSSKPPATDELNLIFFSISHQLLLQLSTGPMLVAIVGGKAIAETLQAIGQASEEVFRGDRLPLLDFPVETESETDERSTIE
jgi:hypothetical protein